MSLPPWEPLDSRRDEHGRLFCDICGVLIVGGDVLTALLGCGPDCSSLLVVCPSEVCVVGAQRRHDMTVVASLN